MKYNKNYNYYEIIGPGDATGMLKQKKGGGSVYMLKEKTWVEVGREIWTKLRLSWMTTTMSEKILKNI